GGGRGQQHIFSQVFGGGGRGQSRGQGSPFNASYDRFSGQPHAVKGQDLVYELSLTLEEAATTTSKIVSYSDGGSQEKVSVKVPAGISTGKKLRLQGKGQAGPYGGPKGDLYILIKVLDHPVFSREGDDLHLTREIKFSEALSGTEIDVPTIDQKTLRLKIPPGTQSNAKFRLKGCGMPHMNGPGQGDIYVKVTIAVPAKINKRQKALLKDMAEAGF
ncbi:MAG: HSP40/DnaJ peptide-binding protein, partial [Desulfobacterales bacterium]|nr:HSP40/DnaJ peptide-binding protein [Desulfobacterales bacterium]